MNVLMLVVDDLNNWTSMLNGYAGTVHTPNLQRLADMGVTFSSAFSTVPLCNPSRTSIMSGQSPLTTGVYMNGQAQFPAVDTAQAMPVVLRQAGYFTATTGKVFGEETSALYDLNMRLSGPPAERDPLNLQQLTKTQPVNYYIGDPNVTSDAQIAQHAVDFLGSFTPQGKDLFLSVGFNRPHGPWNVPKEYFDLYPLDQIQLPQTPPGDLTDLPDMALQLTTTVAFDKTVAAGEWATFVQGYLASVSYADAMLGKVLDALQQSAIANDTMIVLWSDHGYHLGDKDTFHKFTLWEPAARSQLILVDPNGSPLAGQVVDQTVSALDIYSTVLDYAGVAQPDWAQGESLRHFIFTGDASALAGYAVTLIHGSYSIRTNEYRYTRYPDGGEELYHVSADPMDIVNLSGDPASAAIKQQLGAALDHYLADHNVFTSHSAAGAELTGTAGRDNFYAGPGADTLVGGTGNDVYFLSHGTTIQEAAGGGQDLAVTLGSYTLPDNVENLEYDRYNKNAIIRVAADLVGNAGDNVVKATGVEVHMQGLAGNDTLHAIFARGLLDGGEGNDSLIAGLRDDKLLGGSGNDTLNGNPGNNTLDGGAGDDSIVGGLDYDLFVLSGGADTIYDFGGIAGIDISAWGSADTLVTPITGTNGQVLGYNLVHRGTTDHTLWLVRSGSPPFQVVKDGNTTSLLTPMSFSGDRMLADTIVGSSGADSIAGQGGDDSLTGGAGDDWLSAGAGADTVLGGAGNDTIDVAAMRQDSVLGGAGDDLLLVGRGAAKGSIAGGEGADTLSVQGGNVSFLTMTELEDLHFSGAVTASAHRLMTSGVSRLSGEAGAVLTLLGASVAVRPLTVTGDHVAVSAARANDTLLGAAGAQTLAGGAGNDSLDGGAGNDCLIGGDGTDTLAGGEGNDTLDLGAMKLDSGTGGVGDDLFLLAGGFAKGSIDGGAGADTLAVTDSEITFLLLAGVETLDFSGTVVAGVSQLMAAGVQVLQGHAGSRLALNGTSAALRSLAVQGDQVAVTTDQGADTLLGAAGAQTLAGGAGNDSLDGGAGNDCLTGGDGTDTLAGGEGNDILRGEAGSDLLLGGAGADRFVWTLASDGGANSAGADRVGDFTSGADLIDLGSLDSNAATPGVDHQWTYLGTTASRIGYSGAGQFYVKNNATTGMVELHFNLNHDSVDDMMIFFTAGTRFVLPGVGVKVTYGPEIAGNGDFIFFT